MLKQMKKRPHPNDFHDLVTDIRALQSRALAMKLPIAAKLLNEAQNACGWELAGESENALKRLREEFGK